MVWGGGRTLRITVGRADFWDHRGGLHWTPKQSYRNIRSCLEKRDEASLRSLFEDTAPAAGVPRRPSVLPVGRFDLDLGPGARLVRGSLDIDRGELTVHVRKSGRTERIAFGMDMRAPVLWGRLTAGLRVRKVTRIPAWTYVGESLRKVSFEAPGLFGEGSMLGWVQSCPADPALAVACRTEGRDLLLTAERGETPGDARERADAGLRKALAGGRKAFCSRTERWWSHYWSRVPTIEIPNPRLTFLYEYGMYKFAGFTRPGGVPASLQGPWVEEYQMPPWSNDYHFNINVQMCYWPAYHGNRLEHLLPLFRMIEGWLPVLRHNAKVFLGIDDGIMLPHAVDDRCTCMGGFWTGSIDHGCTAWVAEMMYRYYRYTRDRTFLAETAYPFMCGAMRVYEEMLEREGDRLCLPVSVSPEYRGAAMDAWGRDASFQLACIHRLCEDLRDASAILRRKPRAAWHRIQAQLPKACLSGPEGREEIALWRGTCLEESHRHHSHLAGISPFDVLDLDSPEWVPIVERSLRRWVAKGPGYWSGWCVPWASMIHSRVGNADAAELWLEIWDRVFTNEGHGTLHDVGFPGFSLTGKGPLTASVAKPEIMQMDAGMSCVAALYEMLVHERRGVVHLFRGCPSRWARVRFKGILVEGAFVIQARREGGRCGSVKVRSQAGGVLKLANPFGGAARLRMGTRVDRLLRGKVLSVRLAKGEVAVLTPQSR
jgi:hypothetical protein